MLSSTSSTSATQRPRWATRRRRPSGRWWEASPSTAREDKNRLINESHGYRNQIIPEARGQAAQILRQAEAYRETKIRRARGDADRFLATLKEYKKAPYITRKRLYLEMMQEVMPTVEKIIMDEKSGSSVLPILSLRGAAAVKELNKK